MGNLNEEVTIRLVSKLIAIEPLIHSIEVRNAIEEVISDYQITSKNYELVKSDIPEKVFLFLATKKLEGMSKSTMYNYRLTLMNFSNTIYKTVDTITTSDIRLYIAKLVQERNLKSSSQESMIWIFKSFFKWLYDEEYIRKDPMKKIKPPKRERNLRNALNLEQVEKLRLVCKTEKEKAIFEFLLSTGCRVDEVAKLNVSDINWNELSVVVKGKGSKERKIYLSIKAKVYYDQYYSMRKDNTECLFITERQPYRRLEVRSYQRILQAIGQRININLYPHLLRHTFATAMIRNGADIVTVQKLLGHEEASTTQVYAKLDDDFIYNQYKKHLTV